MTSIGEQAFVGCTSLTTITILSSVTSIGYMAFFNCTGLTTAAETRGFATVADWGRRRFVVGRRLLGARLRPGVRQRGQAADI